MHRLSEKNKAVLESERLEINFDNAFLHFVYTRRNLEAHDFDGQGIMRLITLHQLEKISAFKNMRFPEPHDPALIALRDRVCRYEVALSRFLRRRPQP